MVLGDWSVIYGLRLQLVEVASYMQEQKLQRYTNAWKHRHYLYLIPISSIWYIRTEHCWNTNKKLLLFSKVIAIISNIIVICNCNELLLVIEWQIISI